MPTMLTTPLSVTAPNVTLDSVQIDLKRNSDLTIDPANSMLTANLTYRKADGSVLRQDCIQMPFAQVPQSVKTPGASFYSAILAALRASGKLGAGTDTADF